MRRFPHHHPNLLEPSHNMKGNVLNQKQIIRRTVLSFSVLVICFAAGVFLWLHIRQQPQKGGIPSSLRSGLRVNERLFSAAFQPAKLGPTYPRSAAVKAVRVNGDVGLKDPGFDPSKWLLQLIREQGDT